MARKPRIKAPGYAAAYHLISRTAGAEYWLNSHMRKTFISKLKGLKELYYIKYAAFSAMSNHTHLMAVFSDSSDIDEEKAIERWNSYHEKEYRLNPNVEAYRKYVVKELTDVSSFMKRLNLLMTKAYNRYTGKTGTLWQGRFHSTLFERGVSILTGTAYIELNSYRANISDSPEDYKYCSLYHLKNGNRDGLIDIDLLDEGLSISTVNKIHRDKEAFAQEIYTTYRAYIYSVGSEAGKSGKKGGANRVLKITRGMQRKLKKYGIEVERGIFSRRIWEYSRSRFVGSVEYARKLYEEHINPGYMGAEKELHQEKWIHEGSMAQTSLFSLKHRLHTGGSP